MQTPLLSGFTRLDRFVSMAVVLAVFQLHPGPGGGAWAASSRLVYSHAGANDPLSEGGWTLGGGSAFRGGLDAWLVDDRSTAGADWYEQAIPAVHLQGADIEGWTLFFKLAVQDVPDTPDGAIQVLYGNGVDQFELRFTLDPAEGSTRMILGGAAGPTTVDIPGSKHTYSIRYEALAGSASIRIDGVELVTGWVGEPGTSFTGVRFGSAGLSDTGCGAYEYVEWGPLTEDQFYVTHSGSLDPATEGWTRMTTGGGALAGPLQAWRIEDLSTAAGSTGSYLGTPAPDQFDKGLGWTLRARLTVADEAFTPDAAVSLGYDTLAARFYMAFGEDADRNPIVVLWNGVFSSEIAQGAAATIPGSGEHLYELVYDTVAGKADLYVDGAVLLTDYAGFTPPLASARLQWGSGHSLGRGEGWYSLVELEVVTCPDGIIDPNESCDDGNGVDGDGCGADCEIEPQATCSGEPSICTICGDGDVEGSEECDDGGNASGDGCSSACLLEAGWVCDGSPSLCSFCGDGLIEGLEECDDGGTIPGDGCSASCTIETNWTCDGVPSICTLCGDGLVEGIETCDDDGLTPGDGCSEHCQEETGWYCSGEPSVCDTECGDGVLASAEKDAHATMLVADGDGLKLLDLDSDQITIPYWVPGINDIELTDDRSRAYLVTGSGELLRFDFATATVTTLLSGYGDLQEVALVAGGAIAYILEGATRIYLVDLAASPTPPGTLIYQTNPGSLAGLAGARSVLFGYTIRTVSGARSLVELPSGTILPFFEPTAYPGPVVEVVTDKTGVYVWFLTQNPGRSLNLVHQFPLPYAFEFPSNGEAFDLILNNSTYEMFLSGEVGIRSSLDLFQDLGTMRSAVAPTSLSLPRPAGCDDGNLQDGDGCSSSCEIESILQICGLAEGGSVEVTVNGIRVTYPTTPGETGDSIVQGLADLIVSNPNITNLNDHAWADGSRLITDGEITGSSLNDAGLGSCAPQVRPMIRSIEPAGGDLFTITFDEVPGAVGYNLYAGTIAGWYDHGGGSGTRCNLPFTSLGNGMNEATVLLEADDTYILISSHDGVSEGPAGVTSEGLEVDPAQSTCPP